MHRRHLGKESPFAAIGALVEDEPATAGDEPTFPGDPGLQLDDHPFSPVVGSKELLLAREHELHRPPGGAGQGGDMRFEVEIAFRSESTAEQRDDDADVRLREVEGAGDAGTGRKRDLGRGPNGHLFSLPLGKDRPRLDRSTLGGVGDVATA